jgi:hypothetical protein
VNRIRAIARRVPIWAVFIVALVIAMPVSFAIGNRHSTPQPAFNLPVQSVLSRVPGIAGPAVVIGQPVEVRGTKCNVTGKTVLTVGNVTWQSVKPPGASVALPQTLARPFPPACKTFTFFNVMPPEVVTQTRQLLADTGKPVSWQITGTNSVGGYATGVWVTQPFQIVDAP